MHTVCHTIKTLNSPQVEVIIPTLDVINHTPCTAIFTWPARTWRKMTADLRKAPLGGVLAPFNGNTRLIYIGGFEEDAKPSKLIYEYERGRGWRLWRRESPTPIANASFTPIEIDFCRHSNDLKRMRRLDPEGELQSGRESRAPPDQIAYSV